MTLSDPIDVRVEGRVDEAAGIVRFDLGVPADAEPLPAADAGSHVDVEVPGVGVRQYSLVDPVGPGGRRYCIAVQREAASRGGSAWLVEQLRVGQALRIGAPRNHFALAEVDAPTLLLAGGIGITPLLCMAQALHAAGRAFTLHYAGRTRARLAFTDRLLSGPWADRVRLHLDDGAPEQRFDAAAVLAAAAPGTQLYTCGPTGFMDHVLATARAAGWPEDRLHREYFSAAPIDHSADGPFEIVWGVGGQVIPVAADQSAAQAMLDAGISLQLSCEQGVCGTCLTGVISGQPDHRDLYLTDAERKANDRFTPCCSRSCTPRLVLNPGPISH